MMSRRNGLGEAIALLALFGGGCSAAPLGRVPELSPQIPHCIESADVDICEWVTGSDLVVYGVISALDVVEERLEVHNAVEGAEIERASECPVDVDFGLEVTLSVMRATDSLMEGQSVVVSLGHRQTSRWENPPIGTGSNGVTWRDNTRPSLEVGQGLGFALMRGESGVVSPVGEALFAQRPDRVAFQDVDCWPEPELASVDQLFESMCVGTEGSGRLDFKTSNLARPGLTTHSLCSLPEPPSEELWCQYLGDCAPGFRCEENRCIPDE